MDTQYFIEIGLQTSNGPETIARFFAGESCKRAGAIFRKLQGNRDIDDRNIIFLSFVETSNGIPVNLDMIACTLGQLGENCKIITTELFKIYSLSLDTLTHRSNEKVY